MTITELEKALKPEERAFAREYLADYNATAAVLRMGFDGTKPAAANKGSKLLRRPQVREYVDALLREQAESAGVTKDGLIAQLLEIKQRCMAAEPVMTWDAESKSWVESGEYRFDAKGAAKAIEQMSKMLGYDAPVKVGTEDGGAVTLQIAGKAFDDGG